MTNGSESELHLGPDNAASQALGCVASSWAMLELHIDAIIWALADVSPYKGACITAQLPNVSRRLYAFASLVDQHKPKAPLSKKIAQFIDASNKLSRKMNRVIHDPWAHKGSDALADSYRVEVTDEMRLTFNLVPATYTDLFNLSMEIEEHRGKLIQNRLEGSEDRA